MRHARPLPGYQFHSSWTQFGRVELATRRVAPATSDDAAEVTFAVIDGVMCDPETDAPIPGQRLFTAAEYLSTRLHRDPRYGGTVTVAHEHASADGPFKTWCRQRCQSESRKGFVFPARAWDALQSSEIDVVRLAEWDDPRPEVRNLARAERERRIWTAMLKDITQDRDEAMKLARATLTRRETAELLNLSAARVQQLLGRSESS